MPRPGLLALLVLALLGLARAVVELDGMDYEEEEEEVQRPTRSRHNKGAASSNSLKVNRPPEAAEEKQSLVSFSLEHALIDGIFTPCGTFTAKVTHSNVVQAVRITELRLTRDPLSADTEKQLVKLLEYEQYYRVRVPSNVLGISKGRYVMASLPLKCLVNADLNENYVLHLDDLGNVVALDYTTPSGECIMEETAPPAEWGFHPLAYARLPKDAPRLNPDMSAAGAPPPTPGAEGQDLNADAVHSYEPSEEDAQKKKAPDSFFKRYWMYLIPLGLVLVNGLVAPPEEQQKPAAKKR